MVILGLGLVRFAGQRPIPLHRQIVDIFGGVPCLGVPRLLAKEPVRRLAHHENSNSGADIASAPKAAVSG